MVTLTALWLPILVSAVLVWVASALIWTVLPIHKSDWKGTSDEEALRNALKSQNPGLYTVPFAKSRQAMKDPDFRRKFEEGPVGFLTLVGPGQMNMAKPMMLSFVYYLVVGILVAYVASRTLSPGTEYLSVFRITGTVAWLAYAAAVIPEAVWFGRPWGYTAKSVFDGLIYGLLTAGVFGWLWPES